ncbi:type V CRISPR-associated protein Cas12b [Laceyella tengchongensis]
MSIRSFKLKIKTKSGVNAEQLRRGLWRTHQLINDGIAYYMNWLVLLRQEDLFIRNEETNEIEKRSKEEIQGELLERVHKQQQRNQWSGEVDDQTLLQTLRHLYEEIVPSVIGKSGNASLKARFFLGPLVDPNNKTTKDVSKSGPTPKWKKMKDAGDPNWVQEYEKYMAERQTLVRLEEMGLIPLFPMYTDEVGDIHWLPQASGYTRTWDRDMFQQAIERLLSWESWNRRVRERRAQFEKKTHDFASRFSESDVQWMNKLREYEAQQEKSLEENAFAPNEPYALTKKALRGWERVYHSWMRLDSAASEEAYWQEVATCQTAMRGEFGDPAIYQFLAQKENHDIWRGYPERVIDFAELNHLQRELRRAKEDATFTLPDSVDHPLWVRYEAPGGTNIHGYDLVQDTKRNLTLILDKFILPDENGSWHEVKKVPFSLAKSKQFHRQVWLQEEQKQKKREVVFYDYSTNLPHLGTLAGAKLQWDRNFLNKRTQQQIEETGEIGKVFFNISVDVRPAVEVKNGRLQNGLGKALTVLTHPDGTKIVTGWKAEQLEKWVGESGRVSSLGLDSLSEGLRVMSIDLGQRTSATVSVFEITKEAPDNPYKFFYQLEGTEMFAVHQRSFLLALPGENPPQKIKQMREMRWKERNRIKQQVDQLSAILRLHKKVNEDERIQAIDKLLQKVASWQLNEEIATAWNQALSQLYSKAKENDLQWNQAIKNAHHQLEPVVGKQISLWRKDLSTGRQGIAGLSLWSIEELEATKKLLTRWSKRSREPGVVKRIERFETFAKQIQHHINQVKENRLKQLANLIVMTALGYKYDQEQKKWIEVYPACQVVLFENLRSYRFSFERSRRENKKLMEWSHRSIPKLVQMQGELFGLQVADVYAAYSSRYHGRTGAPGIRCHALTEADLRNETNIIHELIEAGFIKEEHRPYLQQGDLVPWSGGELFATLQKPYDNPRILTLHADINAAQNIQKRFWHPSMWFRVNCESVMEGEIVTYVPKNKTVHKKQGKTFRFVKVEGSDVYEWAKWSKNRNKNTFSSITERKPPSSMILFRDPSGTFFKEQEWVEQKTFWGKVQSMIQAYMKKTIVQRMEE